MRHKVLGRHLGRDKDGRQALFRNLIRSLILSESIETTEVKAKAIKGQVDRIISQAKSPTTRRLVSQFLSDAQTTDKLVKDLLPRMKTRSSGFCSIVRVGKRLGDGAMIVQMRLLLDQSTADLPSGGPQSTAKKKTGKAVVSRRKAVSKLEKETSKKAKVKSKK